MACTVENPCGSTGTIALTAIRKMMEKVLKMQISTNNWGNILPAFKNQHKNSKGVFPVTNK